MVKQPHRVEGSKFVLPDPRIRIEIYEPFFVQTVKEVEHF